MAEKNIVGYELLVPYRSHYGIGGSCIEFPELGDLEVDGAGKLLVTYLTFDEGPRIPDVPAQFREAVNRIKLPDELSRNLPEHLRRDFDKWEFVGHNDVGHMTGYLGVLITRFQGYGTIKQMVSQKEKLEYENRVNATKYPQWIAILGMPICTVKLPVPDASAFIKSVRSTPYWTEINTWTVNNQLRELYAPVRANIAA